MTVCYLIYQNTARHTSLLKQCLNCGKEFEGAERKFCSWQCDKSYVKKIKTKLANAMKNDVGHTESLGRC
ncbi:hypothetical protein [Candidatus Nitrosotenuis cloacae]|uniref:hypothetical protein n=1 Tax=Candidatus Nitrosotenuis cloacae TaxID=1603555 RepID=UPI00227DB7BF|nr:hypothetical protein [Candidatus Nitrosotenuis cloacae]